MRHSPESRREIEPDLEPQPPERTIPVRWIEVPTRRIIKPVVEPGVEEEEEEPEEEPVLVPA